MVLKEEIKVPTAPPSTSDAWELFLLRLRYKEGRLLTVSGNQPVLLDDKESAWLVYSGLVDVFAVKVENNAAVGARTHLFRGQTGHLLLGMDLSGRNLGLLVNNAPGTQLLKLRQSKLKELAQEPEYATIIAGLIEQWVVGLSAGIARGIGPKDYEVLEAGKNKSLKSGQTARPKRGLVWVRHTKGESDWLALKDGPPIKGENFFPVSRETWLTALADVELSTLNTEAVVARDPAWESVMAFHHQAIDGVAANLKQNLHSEWERLQDKNTADLTKVEQAFSQLAATWGTTSAIPYSRRDNRDPILAACQLLSSIQQISIVPHPQTDPEGKYSHTQQVERIAQASRVRIRKVVLQGEWWNKDSGPMVAFLEENKKPVVLVYQSNRYQLRDPLEKNTIPINAELAAQLEPFAFTFYRPLPARELNGWDLLRFGMRGAKNDLWMMALMGLAGGLLSTITPIVIGILFDTTIPRGNRSELYVIGAFLLAAAFSSALFQITRSIALLRISSKLDSSIQAAIWDRVLALPAAFFRNYSAGDLSNRAMGIDLIRRTLSGAITLSLFTGIFSIFSFGLLFYYDVSLALIASLLVVFAFIVTSLSGYLQLRYQRRITNIQGNISSRVLQFINGISKFRIAGAENRAFSIWANEFAEQKRLAYRARMVENRLAAFNAIFPIVALMVIFGVVANRDTNALTTGTFLAFYIAFTQFLTASLDLSRTLVSALSVVPIYERAQPILQATPEADDAKSDPGELTGNIEVSNLSFRYRADGPLILRNISLSINRGEFVALVGASGCGKSTLMRLLLGFEKPESGAIFLDGQDLGELDLRAVRRQMGVVLQNSRLMSGDIYTNIIGASLLSIDDAWEAARQAGIEDDIKAMPMGMHTVISEGGSTLSGGQRQRILIARAIVNKPRIIFFDEATSALDNRTQATVSQSLENLDVTRIVIAHRLSTIQNADRIIVMDAGQIVQVGTYQELINQRGLFAQLAKRQFA